MTADQFDPDHLAVIHRALQFAADARLIDLCQTLGLTTTAANAFQDQCTRLYERMDDTP
jgi:isopropylmalate/homocitrate/citramalate synthase